MPGLHRLKITGYSLMNGAKLQIHDFWNQPSCAEDLLLDGADAVGYGALAKALYVLEGKMIFPLARFEKAKGLKMLGLGGGGG